MALDRKPNSMVINGDVYDVVAFAGTSVTFENRRTGEKLSGHPAEFASQEPPRPRKNPRFIQQLPPAQRAAIELLAAHIREVETGVRGDGSTHPEYDVSETTQESRIRAKLRALADAGVPMSRRTFMRKLAAFRADGVTGLIDERWFKLASATARHEGPVLDAVLDVLNESTHQPTRTKQSLVEEVARRVRRAGGVEYPVPSRATLYRLLDLLNAGPDVKAPATTRRSAANRPKRTFTKRVASFPGSEVQVDSTPLDLLVLVDGKPVRPHLTVMVDVSTRMVLSFTLRAKAAKGVDHAYLLLQAMTPRQNRPAIRQQFREELSTLFPSYPLLPWDEYTELAHRHPYIQPRNIHMDNGKDFVSTTFRSTAEYFGIDVSFAAPRTPTDKPHVERFFRSLKEMFIQNLPGFVGGNPTHRGVSPEDDELLTIELLYQLLDDWFMKVYHQRRHDGLRNRNAPTQLISPLEMASQSARSVKQFAPPIGEVQFINFLDAHYRRISDIGVAVAGRQYDSEELHPHRGRRSTNAKKDGKWLVRVDPYNPLAVWVDVGNGKLVECQERGAERRAMLPYLPPLPEIGVRADIAQLEGALTGTPHPQSQLDVAPAAWDIDDDEADDFKYETF